jgi:APA family basic amino acid/polyamine antiporter
VWTGILLIYYFLFELHASYDTAKESGENKAADGWKKMEEGVVSSQVEPESLNANSAN